MTWHEWREAPAGDYAVIGDPVSHSRSPAMHAAAYRELGLDLTYRAIRGPRDEIVQALDHLAALGYKGLNVTVPLKDLAFAWADRPEATVSVNTLCLGSRTGISTDEEGFVRSLPEDLRGPVPTLILGAGGTAQALARRLIRDGRLLQVWNRTPARWDGFLAEHPGAIQVAEPDPAGCRLIINATSAGLSGESPPVLWDRIAPDALAVDLVYGRRTPFLEQAEAAGVATLDGT
ncbi:MAG: hypothetical protein MH204_11745, partial [Fimbriimonadaceae bacterium]|nr:hypothetical protein [Fimbriimonadaceae bacterium]